MITGNLTYTCRYYCANCPENIICSDYYAWMDGLFLASVLLTAVFALACSYTLSGHTFNRFIHHLSGLFVGVCGIVGIILRFRIIEPGHNPLLSSVMLIFHLNSTFHGLQIRFFHSCVALIMTCAVWIIVNSPNISGTHLQNFNNSFISGLALISTSCLIIFGLRQSEMFYRDQFLRGILSTRVNQRLVDQLKALQQSYSNGAVDFETPLEKSMAILRGLMSNPMLTQEQFHSMALILQLLNSPQLLTPDFENQLIGSLD